MRAMVVVDPGPSGRLVAREVPDPVPEAGEVLVRVAAAGANPIDRHLVSGRVAAMLGSRGPAASIPGVDGAGTVVDVGAGVPRSQIGERVMINGALTCGRCASCTAGDDGMCAARRAMGQLADGTYAELVAIPAENALAIPDALGFEEAAAIPSVTLTAWQALVRRADLCRGETVVVSGAAGGVGGAAIQVARHLGARVIAVASTPEKVDHAMRLGADAGVVASDRLADDLLAASDGGADVVLDVTGPSAWQTWIRASVRSGRIVTCASDWSAAPDLSGFGPRQLSLLATGPFGSKADAAEIQRLAGGAIRGVVGQVLPLEEADTAHRRHADRAAIGKVILTP